MTREIASRSADLNGARIHWREAGAGDAVLLVHAFPLDGRMWTPQLESLPPTRRWIAPDLRGFGASQAPTGPLSMDTFADDLAALLDHLELDQATLCGVSMGGYIAFAFWRRHAHRLRRLVLCDTRAAADSPEGRMTRRVASERVRVEGADVISDLMLERLLAESTRARAPAVVDAVSEMLEATRADSYIRAQAAMARRPDSTDDLPGIGLPVLVVVGEEDALVTEAEARELAERVPDGRLAVIAGAGHLPNLEQPQAFNAALQSFLGSP